MSAVLTGLVPYPMLNDAAPVAVALQAHPALNWLTTRAGVSSVILGARSEEQLADNLAAATWSLSEEELRQLDDLTTPRILYPYWHQWNTSRGRLGAMSDRRRRYSWSGTRALSATSPS